MLCEHVGYPELLTTEHVEKLHSLLGEHHNLFCLDPHECGETDLISMEIDTGDVLSRRRIDIQAKVTLKYAGYPTLKE